MAQKRRNQKNKNYKSSAKAKISKNKTKEIESHFRHELKSDRENYLSKELEKYKNIKISYD